ncbi:MAG: Tm-1-like ATP-binding domain-containing protein [Alphaproteobacteria bacterium]|nr:Tm-1-like ATP-binding domain-containing protein [Alphaproteobacteria bacterium]
MSKTILIIGTYDTKQAELNFLAEVIQNAGGNIWQMDVSVLGDSETKCETSKHDVMQMAGTDLQQLLSLDDENLAFQKMAQGAKQKTTELYRAGKIDGMIVLGGTMGTDLALDCANALPIGVPKLIVSTIAFSPLIPIERLPTDAQMMLWAGGLYGLNSICKAILSQAAGSVLGAAQTAQPYKRDKPLIGMTSLGKTTLTYMTVLKPELEKRGFELAVFHSTGLGGRAFENLAKQYQFACVFDFCLQEFINGINQSPVNSGADRLSNAGLAEIPQLIAPGATDIIDFLAHESPPENLAGRAHHAHNRLIDSALATPEERRELVHAMLKKLKSATTPIKAPVHIFIPKLGVEEWDREGNPAYHPEGLHAFNQAAEEILVPNIPTTMLDCHINDKAFTDAVLTVFDEWLAKGIVNNK